jgi:PPP family 3-phenylpropionic acid transporter
LVPSSLYSTGQSIASTVGFGVAPIIGGIAGGYVYETFGPVTMYVGASCLVLVGAAVSWFSLATPEFSEPSPPEPAEQVTTAPEPGRVP